eukprot:g20876.t1
MAKAQQNKFLCRKHENSLDTTPWFGQVVRFGWGLVRPDFQQHQICVEMNPDSAEAQEHPDAKAGEGRLPPPVAFPLRLYGRRGAVDRASRYLRGESYTLAAVSWSAYAYAMHAFEDWSPHAHGKELFPLPLPVVSKRAFWMRTAQITTLVLSFCTALSGIICWRKFAELAQSGILEDSVHFDAEKLRNLSHLVLVAGHAVVMADSLEHVLHRDSDWFLEPYQLHQDLPEALVSHIHAGVRLAAFDPTALLIFSGGQTRAAAGPRDEGWSYYRLAEHFSCEDESICLQEVVGHYPERITVVSFGFKKHRFGDLHRKALRFPSSRFSFVGIQPPPKSRFDLARAEQGELQRLGLGLEPKELGLLSLAC